MELMVKTAQFEQERRESQSHATKVEETYAQQREAFQSQLWTLHQQNWEIAERSRRVQESLEAQIVDVQGQWIEAESEKHAAKSELHAVQAALAEERERSLCCICFERPRCIVLQPCWHYALCDTCAHFVSCCPICRQSVLQHNRIIVA